MPEKIHRTGPERVKGRFAPGHSGNPKGRPKTSRNLKSYLLEQLAQKVQVTENGRPRKVSKAEAIAIQLVAMAARGDPKGIAAVMALTRESEQIASEVASTEFGRAEDQEVVAGLLERLRAETSPPGAALDVRRSVGSGLDCPGEPPHVQSAGISPTPDAGAGPASTSSRQFDRQAEADDDATDDDE